MNDKIFYYDNEGKLYCNNLNLSISVTDILSIAHTPKDLEWISETLIETIECETEDMLDEME